ncbi:hypothetical protein FJTKL_05970 [Diaporthe vaccinii]|uniref:Uncharacterized protein n=1 Tax=Diaporthe vaccinii TaxID=105482 RepID=A0ABR4DQY6_9PEZI
MSASTDLQLVEDFRISFITFLLCRPNTQRLLPKWRVHLRENLTAPEDNTGRVFFDHGGAQAWVAYEAHRPPAKNYSGRTETIRRFNQLDKQPYESKARLARMVGTVTPHPAVGELISTVGEFGRSINGSGTHWPGQNMTPAKRRHNEVEVEHSAPPARNDTVLQECPPGWPSTTPVPTPPTSRYPEAVMTKFGGQEVEENVTKAKIDETASRTGATVQGLLELLVPQGLIGATRQEFVGKDVLKFAVTVDYFPLQLEAPCVISFEILDQKVEYFAQKLFNAHLEREGEFRVFYYDGDKRRVTMGSEFALRSCTMQAIPEFFGPNIDAGNLEMPQRQMEMLAGSSVTDTIKMSGFNRIGNGAHITVSLGPVGAYQCLDMLYRRR